LERALGFFGVGVRQARVGDAEQPLSVKRERRWAELGLGPAVCTLLMSVSMMMVVWNLQDASLTNANTGSRYATIEALVDQHTYHIDRTHYLFTIDKYKVGPNFISSKPPTLPTIGAGVYWVYRELTGKTIARYEGDVVRLVSFCTGGICHLLFLIYFYRLCRLLLARELAIIASMAGACFGYLGVAYATHINNHSTAAALAVMGFYYAVRIRQEHQVRLWHWPLAGLALGLLPAIDLSGVAITALIGLYLLSYDWKKTLLYFVPALLPGLVTHFALTYYISGSFKPFYLNSALKTFKQFYFRTAGGIDGLHEPKTTYAFNVLLGHHGLFSMTPLYCFGLWELVRSIRRRQLLAESLVSALAILAYCAYYILRTRNYGGWCVGMRWLIPVMPFLLLYFGRWLDRVRVTSPVWLAVVLAFAVSCFNVQDGLSSPLQYSVWHNWLENAPNRNRVGKEFNLPKRRAPKKKRGAKAVPVPVEPAQQEAGPADTTD